jgi:signal transduction histidine kinase
VTVESTPAPRRRGRFHVRKLTVLVLVAFTMISAGLFLGARRLNANAERRLLAERTAEVGGVLSSAVASGVQSILTSLATASQRATTGEFTRTAQAQVSSGSVSVIALVVHRGSTWVVQAAAGRALSVGQPVTGPRLAVIKSAGAQLRTDIFVVSPGQSRLGIVLGPPAAAAGTVVYEEIVVDPARPTQLTKSQPFHELNVALYVGPRAVADKLLIATTRAVPLQGRTATSTVQVGGSSWLIVANARQPLAGALAHNVPVIVLLAAILIGLAMAALVEIVVRRRDYALWLVAQRTTDLRDSLGQLEQAQHALVASERLAALGQMAATVGHELRNPLGVLTNSLYLIRKTVTNSDEKVHRQLDTADREISAATLIVSDLLEFARPRTADPTTLDVHELLIEAVSVAPPPSGITVEHDDDVVPPIVADRDQTRQIVLNLLTNAYEAMPNGGTVRITARVVADAVEVSVSDTGIGMDENTRGQVFDPFFSLKIKGTGLGLAVSKRMAESNSGTLTIVSQEGHGCTATISLPLSHVVVGAGA